MKPVYIDWEKQDITIIEKNGYMTKVRDEYSEGEGLIPDREIYFLMKASCISVFVIVSCCQKR